MARRNAKRRALRLHARKSVWTLLTLLVALVFSYPFILTLFTSVKPEDEIIDNPFALPHSINLDAYRTAWDVLDQQAPTVPGAQRQRLVLLERWLQRHVGHRIVWPHRPDRPDGLPRLGPGPGRGEPPP